MYIYIYIYNFFFFFLPSHMLKKCVAYFALAQIEHCRYLYHFSTLKNSAFNSCNYNLCFLCVAFIITVETGCHSVHIPSVCYLKM